MKLIAACDGRDLAGFLGTLAHLVPLEGAAVIFAHVVDNTFEEGWQQVAGHHWLGRRPGPRELTHVHEAATHSAREILAEALDLSRDWPAGSRQTVELQGNPERELVGLALAEHADMLAVGQHRLELGPHALGRCARFVIDHAPCPVLLVRGEAIQIAAADLLRDRPKGPRHPPQPR